MSEKAPRTLEERIQFDYQDVEDIVTADIAEQRRQQAMAVYNGSRSDAKNASARARRREQKLEQMQALQDHLADMDTPYVGKHERPEPLADLVHGDDKESFDLEAEAEQLAGIYSGDVFYNDANQTVVSIGESRNVGNEEVVRVVTETKLASGKTKKVVRELPRDKAYEYVDSLNVDLIEPGYERVSAAEKTDDYATELAPQFKEGAYVTWNGKLYKIDTIGDSQDQGDRFMRLVPAYGTDSEAVDTFERTLLEDGAEAASTDELQNLDFNNGMDAIAANVIAGGITLEEAQAQVIALGEQTGRPQSVIDTVVNGLAAFVKAEPATRAQIEDYEYLLVPEDSETSADEATPEEATPEVSSKPKSLKERAQELALKPVVAAQLARTEKGGSDSKEKKSRRKLVIAGIGVAALAVTAYVAYKTGMIPKFNGDTAQTAQDAANSANKHVTKLTKLQAALISAPGKYPYGHYEHIYGADAADQIHKAVRRLHAAGVKVIEHGSGKDYWIEVPAKHGGGMTANTKRVVEVLATGRV